MLKAIESISSGVTRGTSVMAASRPSTRRYGWLPTLRCKSEALLSTARRNRSSMLRDIACELRSSATLCDVSIREEREQEIRRGALRGSYWRRAYSRLQGRKRLNTERAEVGAQRSAGKTTQTVGGLGLFEE